MGSSYGYQYETSPRKLKPNYEPPKTQKKVTKSKPKKVSKTSKEKQKQKDIKLANKHFVMIMIVFLGCILFMMYRNVKINEAFSGVQALSKTVSGIEKENSQIAVNIQNNLNLSNIENFATSMLGMQKLTNKQTIYITLDAKDYVEISSDKIIKEDNESFLKKIWNKICDLF